MKFLINILISLSFIIIADFAYCQDVIFDNKVPIYKKDGGIKVCDIKIKVIYSIASNNYKLTIGNDNEILDNDGNPINIWIFNKSIEYKKLSKEISDITCKENIKFKPINEHNDFTFSFPDYKKITDKEPILFTYNSDKKDKVSLDLKLYVGTPGKRKEIIEEANLINLKLIFPESKTEKDKETLAKNQSLKESKGIGISMDTTEFKNQDEVDSIKFALKTISLDEFITKSNLELEKLIKNIDTFKIEDLTDERKDSIKNIAKILEKKVNTRKMSPENISILENNEELENKFIQFDFYCEQVNEKLLKTEKEPVNMLLVIGICLGAIMIVMPLAMQLKGKMQIKKQMKEQEKLAKKQEKEMLLTNDDSIKNI